MVREQPPSPAPPAGRPRPSVRRSHPNPAVKPAPQRRAQSRPSTAEVPRTRTVRAPAQGGEHTRPTPQAHARPSGRRGRFTAVLARVGSAIGQGLLRGTSRFGVRRPQQLAALGLGLLAVIGLLYGSVMLTTTVHNAQRLNAYPARIITGVVIDQGFAGPTVDIHGQSLTLASTVDEPVVPGQPMRLRVHPDNPAYVVDARLSVDEVISQAKRSRLIAVVLSGVVLAGALVWFRHARTSG